MKSRVSSRKEALSPMSYHPTSTRTRDSFSISPRQRMMASPLLAMGLPLIPSPIKPLLGIPREIEVRYN
jgi:hypothetical protein